jgi:hypothetical protein
MFKRFSAGFAVGYVFGARAGQKRYEQIADLADKVMDMPLVSRATERAQDLATGENGRRLVDSLKGRVPFPRSADDEDDDESGNEDEPGEEEGDAEDGEGSAADASSNGSSRRRPDRHQTAKRQQSRGRPSRGQPRKGRVGSLASAALERGRVD